MFWFPSWHCFLLEVVFMACISEGQEVCWLRTALVLWMLRSKFKVFVRMLILRCLLRNKRKWLCPLGNALPATKKLSKRFLELPGYCAWRRWSPWWRILLACHGRGKQLILFPSSFSLCLQFLPSCWFSLSHCLCVHTSLLSSVCPFLGRPISFCWAGAYGWDGYQPKMDQFC